MVKIKRLATSSALALSAAVISVVGPFYQLNAYADDYILVKAPGANIEEKSYGGISSWDYTWTIGSASVTLTAGSGAPIVDDGGQKALQFAGTTELKNGLEFAYPENFCDSYVSKLVATSGGFQKELECGQYGALMLPADTNLPGDVSSYIVTVETKTQPTWYSAVFDNVQSYDENEQKYVVVSSPDSSLAGKQFTITADNAVIGGKGDEHGTIYSIDTQDENVYRNLSLTISGDDFDSDTMAMVLHGENNYQEVTECTRVGSGCVVSFNQYNPTDQVNIDILSKNNPQPGPEPGPQPHPGDPTDGTVTVHSTSGKSFYKSRVAINDTPVIDSQDCEFDDSQCPDTYTGNITYNKETDKNTVEISFSPLFIRKINGPIIINGTSYNVPINYSNRASWLSHYDHQELKFTFDTVPYAASYDITVDVADANPEEIYIGNFLWSNSEETKERDPDAYIGHARIEPVSILCHIDEGNDVLITRDTENIPEGCVVEFDDNGLDGSLVVPDGSVVTLKLWTEYGWQVTSFGANGQTISVDPDKIAEYTFTIAKGNFHLGAVVTQVSDEVNADSEKIKAGSISLGGSEIDEGTALLTVGDADLTEEERQQFQQEANGYNISSYLEIDLDQIFYDGHGSYWKGAEMKELDNEATITLELEEGVNGNEVVIVHKKHDGTYEIIPTTYDPVAHTITFKTSSFSDYAIASRTVAAPKTYDDIMRYVAIFTLCAGASLIIFARYRLAKKASE